MDSGSWPDGYRRAIAFYLRDDVAECLYVLAQRRRLHFYYQTDRDYRLRAASRSHVAVHCPRSVTALKATILAATAGVTECGSPFFPFFTMATLANAPGDPDRVLGWDLCFECDLDLEGSFRALVPLVGVLDHYRVPHLAKYSGHRSLHVVVPGEALVPASWRVSPGDWKSAQDRLGRLFCRLVPGMSATLAGVAKQQPLSAPYSLHRYNGLVSLPLALDEALEFDPASSEVERFAGVSWRPEQWDDASGGATGLLALAESSERDVIAALDTASSAFGGERWSRYVEHGRENAESVKAVILAGAVGLPHLPEEIRRESVLVGRVRRAIAAFDNPAVKTMRVQRLFLPDGGDIVPFAGRVEASRVLAAWATGGAESALGMLVGELEARVESANSVVRAARLLGVLPESADGKLRAIEQRWRARLGKPDSIGLFLALALGELAATTPEAGRLLAIAVPDSKTGRRRAWLDLVSKEVWRAEERPARALAALGLAFGANAIAEWLREPESAGSHVLLGVFGGDAPKLAYAGKVLLGSAV